MTSVIIFLITCLVSKILKDKKRTKSSAMLDIQKVHDVTTWIIVLSLEEARTNVEC